VNPLRRLILSDADMLLLAAAIFLLHGTWAVHSTAYGDELAGFGAAIIVWGVMLTARPFARSSIEEAAANLLPPVEGCFVSDSGVSEHNLDRERKRPQARRDAIAERIVGPGAIVLGTLINGYSGALARLFAA
jgi:hypothetical protein